MSPNKKAALLSPIHIGAVFLCATVFVGVTAKRIRNLPKNWREFIDPEILAESDEESTRYDSDYLEGDILGLQTLELVQGAANAANDASLFWPNHTLPYEFSKKQNAQMTAKEMQIILDSMRIISLLSGNCIKFVVRTTEEDYISFQKGIQCMSNIGRTGGKQAVIYSTGCLKHHGDVQHELMHAMGFFHEHSRSDRDEHIKIIWGNIAKGDRDQFAKHEDGNTYGLPYDYESVMHYKYNAFAKDSSNPTILPKKLRSKIGQNKNLSPLDIARIHRRFHCAIADPINFAGASSRDEEPLNCPRPQPSDEEQTECDDGNKQESTIDSFPQFSGEPMSRDQCALQYTDQCEPPLYTIDHCTKAYALFLSCDNRISVDDLKKITTAMSKPPLRPIFLALYDSEKVTLSNLQAVQRQTVALSISYCISNRPTQKLTQLRFTNLLQFQLLHCYGMEIKKNDFSQSSKIKIIAFTNTTILSLEQDTFTDLPALKLLSLEYGLNQMDTFTKSLRDYLKKLHCSCEFQWFRDWWSSNQDLLREAKKDEIFNILGQFGSPPVSKAETYLPIDCAVDSHSIGPASIDHKQYRFSINEPDDCPAKLENAKDTFPTFSISPMTAAECSAQFTANCQPWDHTKWDCPFNKRFEVNCNRKVRINEVTGMVEAIVKSPVRPVGLFVYDGSAFSLTSIAPVRKQVVRYQLVYCTSSRSSEKLREVRLPNLLAFTLMHCYDLVAQKADFEYSQKIRVAVFRNSTFLSLESDTFSQLLGLRILSLEYDLNTAPTFSPEASNYLQHLHCWCDFASFRAWRKCQVQLLRTAEEGVVYHIPDGYSNSRYNEGNIYLPIDCNAYPFPGRIDLRQTEFSLNEPDCFSDSIPTGFGGSLDTGFGGSLDTGFGGGR
ncbi:uncharacterized protein LOC129596010 [Paramacrobiotus metropolitanus]|uniref:uncharacterized protein LOC129596010 n=1 Tax=Paramacrobiotus metropolitanus TaxID=2943436 RepID=UPI002445AB80|nr:uncharacterized protein LOC129596010 [Paramacrobiotus metropolitanus]